MSAVAILVYRALTTALIPPVIGGFVLRSLSQPLYRARLCERMGSVNIVKSQPRLVIHGASVGEVSALRPFIEKVLKELPQYQVVVTCFTPTGSAFIQQHFAERVEHCYIPWDSPWCVARFLDALQPTAMVVMETELWPSLLTQAKKRGIKLMLVNGRLSKKSVARYSKLGGIVKPALLAFDFILAQSTENKARFIAIGAPAEKVKTSGNLKLDLTVPAGVAEQAEAFKTQLGGRLVWVVGSSHEKEEDLLIESFIQLKQRHHNLLMILAPRHKERFSEVPKKLVAADLNYISRSKARQPAVSDDVWLVDTLGELLLFYGVGDVCTVAGSFSDIGGHNPLEPGLFGKATTLGPDMSNSKQLMESLLASGCVIQHESATKGCIVRDVDFLLTNDAQRSALGRASRSYIERGRGATDKAFQCLKTLIT